MTTSRKLLITAAAIALPVLAYLALSGGEDSYSEKQRIAWNELIRLKNKTYPGRYVSTTFFGETPSGYDPDKLERLRQAEGSDWGITLSEHPDLSRLPLDGLTEEELIKRIDNQHDARACLELSQRYGWETYATISQKKKWIARAAGFGIPEASYLLEIMAHHESELPVLFDDLSERLEGAELMDFSYLQSLPGYEDFKQAIALGNRDLYLSLISIDAAFVASPFHEQYKDGLRKRLTQQDSAAGWQLAELELYPYFFCNYGMEKIEQDTTKPKPEWLNTIREWMDLDPLPGKSATWERAAHNARQLEKGANAGNLQAMRIWLAYCYVQAPFDHSDWEALFSCSNALLDAGHAGFIKETDSCIEWEIDYIPQNFLMLHYSKDSVDRFRPAARRVLLARGHSDMVFKNLFKSGQSLYGEQIELADHAADREALLAHLERVEALCPGQLYRHNWYRLFFERDLHPDVKRKITDIIAAHARQGDPLACCALGDLIVKGWIQSDRNIRELWEQTWPAAKKYNTYYFFYGNEQSQKIVSSAFLVYDGLMTLYLAEPQHRDIRRALELADDYQAFEDGFCRYKTFYHLGLMHERGWGVDRNSELALSLYQKGAEVFDYRCLVSLARCYEHAIGTPQDLDKALEYYRKADEMNPTALIGETLDPEEIEQAILRIEQMKQTGDAPPSAP